MQEIIVYRNPAEAAFWHSMSNGGFITFVIFGGVMLCMFAILYFGLTKLLGKGRWRGDGGDWIMGACLAASFLCACFAVWFKA